MSDDEGSVGRALGRVDRLQQSISALSLWSSRSSSATARTARAARPRSSPSTASSRSSRCSCSSSRSPRSLFGESTLKKDIVDSALAQFPVIGDQLASNIHAIAVGNSFAVFAAVLGLIWGSFGITNSLQSASASVWHRPRTEDPSIWRRLGKGLELLGVLAAVCVLSTVVAGVAANGVERFGLSGNVGRALAFAAVLVANAAGYVVALRLLAPRATPWRTILPGAVLGAAGWTVLQVVGGLLIGHRLHHASQFYGLFASSSV